MKLPGIKYEHSVHSLGRESIHGAVEASRAKTRAVLSAINVTGGAVINALSAYHTRQTELGIESAALGMAQAENSFSKKYGEQVQYSAEELPPEGFEEVKTHRTTLTEDGEVISVPRKIPAYEVRPELYKQYMEKQIQVQAESIPDERVRQDWVKQQEQVLEKNYGRHIAKAIQEQVGVAQDIRTAKYNLAVDEGRWQVAREIVKSMEIPPEEQEVFFREVNKKEEMGGYKSDHANLDVEAMQADIEHLLREDYNEVGFLNETERDTTVSYLRSGISTVMQKRKSEASVAKGILQKDVRSTKDILKSGRWVDPTILSSVIARTREYPDMVDDEYEILNLQTAQTALSQLMADGVRFSEQEEYINRLISDANSNGDIQALTIAHDLSEMHKKSRQLYESDTPSWMGQYGGFEMVPITPENVAKVGARRLIEVQSVEDQFGAVSGILRKSEIDSFATAIRSNGTAANLKLAEDLYLAFGEDVGPILEDLSDAGAGRTFSMAGEMIANGNTMGAKLVFEGAELSRNNKNYTQGYQIELDRFFDDQLQNLPGLDPQRRASLRQAAVNAYVALADKDGVAGGVFDSSLAKQAYNSVIGQKLHRFEGYDVELPTGWTGKNFDEFMRDTHPSYIDMHWKPAQGWTGPKLWKAIRNGDVELHKFSGNQYLVWDTNIDQAVLEKVTRPDGKSDMRPILFNPTLDRISWAEYKRRNKPEGLVPEHHGWEGEGGLRERIHRQAAETNLRMEEYRESQQ